MFAPAGPDTEDEQDQPERVHAQYHHKANLGLLTSRYGDLERRVLERFVIDTELTEVTVDSSHELLLEYLIRDGILEYRGPAERAFIIGGILEDSPPIVNVPSTTVRHAGA